MRLRAGIATAAAGLVLAACTTVGSTSPVGSSPSDGSAARDAGEVGMPSAPRDQGRWLARVDRIYDDVGGGRSAEQWLRTRSAHRRPGERLAIVLGVDDVMLQTHFAGLDALVPRSARLARTAHALGYSVFYVTGRSATSGLGRVESVLERAHVPANAFYGRPIGAQDEESAKAECRAVIKKQGYTLAMVVAASEASFDGDPEPEKEVRLPDFSLRG